MHWRIYRSEYERDHRLPSARVLVPELLPVCAVLLLRPHHHLTCRHRREQPRCGRPHQPRHNARGRAGGRTGPGAGERGERGPAECLEEVVRETHEPEAVPARDRARARARRAQGAHGKVRVQVRELAELRGAVVSDSYDRDHGKDGRTLQKSRTRARTVTFARYVPATYGEAMEYVGP
jgi:hypothetical protein